MSTCSSAKICVKKKKKIEQRQWFLSHLCVCVCVCVCVRESVKLSY